MTSTRARPVHLGRGVKEAGFSVRREQRHLSRSGEGEADILDPRPPGNACQRRNLQRATNRYPAMDESDSASFGRSGARTLPWCRVLDATGRSEARVSAAPTNRPQDGSFEDTW